MRSVKRSICGNFETLVVDNGSTDNSLQILQEQLPGTTVLVSPKNLGYAGGNNLGIRRALENRAEQVLLLNNDTVVDERMLEILGAAAASDPAVGILSPAIYYHDQPERIWRLGAVQSGWWPMPREIGRNDLDRHQYRQALSVDYVTGCAMWIRRELLEDIGLLDEGFFMNYEDADFCVRARRRGWRIQVVPQAKIWHKISLSVRRQASLASYYQVRNRIVFYNRYYRSWRRWIINGYIFTQILARFLADGADRKYLRAGFRDGLAKITGEKVF